MIYVIYAYVTVYTCVYLVREAAPQGCTRELGGHGGCGFLPG